MIALLTPEQASKSLGGIPVKTLYKWRADGYGPQSIKVGKYLRYRPETVEAWIKAQEEKSHG